MKTVIVFKTHVDIGFTDLAANVIRKYTENLLPLAAQVCEDTQTAGPGNCYVWTLPSWVMKYCLENEPAISGFSERVKKLIHAGQLVWHALPFTTHTEFFGTEEFIRGLLISKNLSDEYGHRPVSAKMTDVPGHTWMLPSILAGAGVEFLHLGCNPSAMPPDVPRLFWWEGPDGKRVLTFYSKGEYGSSLIPPEDWPYPVWLALIQTGDNHGPQKASDVNAILDEFREVSHGGQAVIGTLDDFYHELIKHPLNIPVIKKDLADTWIHGTGTYPLETSRLRVLRGRMTETEKVLSVLSLLGLLKDEDEAKAKAYFNKAFEQCLLYGEHTWGMDVKTWLGYGRMYSKKGFLAQKAEPRYQMIERSWDEQRSHARIAEEETDNAATLAGITQDSDVIRFNGLGWEREGLPGFGYGRSAVPARNGTVLCDAAEGLLENNWFIIRVDAATGTIKSLYEKAKNKEWVNQNDPHGLGRFRYDIYGDDDITEFTRTYTYRFFDWSVNDLGRMGYPGHPHLTFNTGEFAVRAAFCEDYSSLILQSKIENRSSAEYGNAHELNVTITLYNDKPVIDLKYELNNKEETPMVEAGHFVFPLKLEHARIHLNKLGCVLDIYDDIIDGANHAVHCLEHFIDVTDGCSGMAFIPRHTHLVSAGEQSILKYKAVAENAAPILFFNAFNNSYGTNFPQWMSGDLSFEFRLIPHDGDWKQGDIYRKALEYKIPVMNVSGNSTLENLSWFEGLEGMEILAFKPAEKNNGFILRLHDITGECHPVSFTVPQIFSRIAECNITENITAVNSGRTISFVTRPFGIHSFYLYGIQDVKK